MKILKIISIPVSVFIFLYLLFAFCNADMNVAHWIESTRFMFGLIDFCITLWLIIIAYGCL